MNRKSGLSKGRVYALQQHLAAHVAMLKEEVNIMLDNPIFVAGHSGYFKEVEDKLAEMHEYEGILTVIERYFDE